MKKNIVLFLLIFQLAETAYEDQWESYLTNNSDTNCVRAIVPEGTSIWALTTAGIVKWEGFYGNYNWDMYLAKYTVEKNGDFLSAAIDWNGVKWFGSIGSIYAYNDSIWTVFNGDNTDLLKKWSGPIRSIAKDSVNKRMIFSTYKGLTEHACNLALLSYDGEKWEELINVGGSTFFPALKSIAVDPMNPWNIWGSGYQNYLYYFEKTDQGYTISVMGGSNLFVTSLAIDHDNNVWMIAPDIVLYDRNKKTTFKFTSDVTGAIYQPVQVVIDHNGIKWFGSDRSLIRYDDKTWTVYPFNNKGEFDNLLALSVDDRNDVWMGRGWDGYSRGYGLWRFHLPATGVNEDAALPQDIKIIGNSPNPFNPLTTITFSVPKSGHVSLVLYNAAGQKVRELVSGNQTAGMHSVVWDGRNDFKKSVSSGVYISQLTAGKHIVAGKMLLIR